MFQVSTIIRFKWLWDLCEPDAPGQIFSRYGHRVIVSESNFHAAQAELAAGAKEVMFDGRRTNDHYELESLTAIR